jgi:hypothetical protein
MLSRFHHALMSNAVFAHISVSEVATPDGMFSEVVDLFSPSCLYETVSMVPRYSQQRVAP